MTFTKFMNNMKKRKVRCVSCKKEDYTDEPNPKCKFCGWSMVTVISLTDWRDPQ